MSSALFSVVTALVLLSEVSAAQNANLPKNFLLHAQFLAGW
jgi:hypothetical protein